MYHISKRQEYNYKILSIIKATYPEMTDKFSLIKEKIDTYPEQRFGQIMCNYICPDYRSKDVSSLTVHIMESIFPGNPDPFFEESITTLKRLTGK